MEIPLGKELAGRGRSVGDVGVVVAGFRVDAVSGIGQQLRVASRAVPRRGRR